MNAKYEYPEAVGAQRAYNDAPGDVDVQFEKASTQLNALDAFLLLANATLPGEIIASIVQFCAVIVDCSVFEIQDAAVLRRHRRTDANIQGEQSRQMLNQALTRSSQGQLATIRKCASEFAKNAAPILQRWHFVAFILVIDKATLTLDNTMLSQSVIDLSQMVPTRVRDGFDHHHPATVLTSHSHRGKRKAAILNCAFMLRQFCQPTSNLTDLNLSGQPVHSEGCFAIRSLLQAEKSNLTSVNLSSCRLGESGLEARSNGGDLGAASDGMHGVVALVKCVEHSSTLTELDLSRNALCTGIGIQDAFAGTTTVHPVVKALGGVLRRNTALTSLDLRNNGIGREGAALLCSALRQNRTLGTISKIPLAGIKGGYRGEEMAAATDSELAGGPTDRSTGGPTDRSTDVPTDRSTGELTEELTRQIDRSCGLEELDVSTHKIGEADALVLTDALLGFLQLEFHGVGAPGAPGAPGAQGAAGSIVEVAEISVAGWAAPPEEFAALGAVRYCCGMPRAATSAITNNVRGKVSGCLAQQVSVIYTNTEYCLYCLPTLYTCILPLLPLVSQPPGGADRARGMHVRGQGTTS
jgi:hypothetical protein